MKQHNAASSSSKGTKGFGINYVSLMLLLLSAFIVLSIEDSTEPLTPEVNRLPEESAQSLGMTPLDNLFSPGTNDILPEGYAALTAILQHHDVQAVVEVRGALVEALARATALEAALQESGLRESVVKAYAVASPVVQTRVQFYWEPPHQKSYALAPKDSL